jgi:hypothetical protein
MKNLVFYRFFANHKRELEFEDFKVDSIYDAEVQLFSLRRDYFFSTLNEYNIITNENDINSVDDFCLLIGFDPSFAEMFELIERDDFNELITSHLPKIKKIVFWEMDTGWTNYGYEQYQKLSNKFKQYFDEKNIPIQIFTNAMSFLYDKNVKYWPSHNSMVLERLVDELEKVDYYNIEYPKAKYFYATSNSLNVDRVHFYKYLSDNNLWDKNNVALFSTHRNNDLGYKGFNYSYVRELRGQCGLNDIDDTFTFYPKPFDNENFKTMNYSVLSNVEKLKESYFEMVFETIFEANENMIIQTSEKTFKPLIQKTPFISFSYPHILRELKSLGFKTFDFIFDETYDNIENTHERLYKVLGEIGKVCNMSLEELKQYDDNIKEITEHNFLNVKRLFSVWREQLKKSVNYE